MSELTKITLSRSVSATLYNVSMIYMRSKNLSCAKVDIDNLGELSLLQELKFILGDIPFSKIMVAFAGMTIRFP